MTVYLTSETLPRRTASRALTAVLAERIARHTKTGVGRIGYLGSGKPVFQTGGRYLSVSHTGGRLYVAVADFPIGLDAEARREVPERVAREWLTEDERKRDFFAVWTAKEAVSKWDGRGLSMMKQIHVGENVAMAEGLFFTLQTQERDGVVITVAARDDFDLEWVE